MTTTDQGYTELAERAHEARLAAQQAEAARTEAEGKLQALQDEQRARQAAEKRAQQESFVARYSDLRLAADVAVADAMKRIEEAVPDLAAAFRAYVAWREARMEVVGIWDAYRRALHGVGTPEAVEWAERNLALPYQEGDFVKTFDQVIHEIVSDRMNGVRARAISRGWDR